MAGNHWVNPVLVALIAAVMLVLAVLESRPQAVKPEPSETAAASEDFGTSTPTVMRASTLAAAHARIPKPTSTRQSYKITPTPLPTIGTQTELPESFYIENVQGHPQWFSIGCEASAAVDWAGYYGVNINEREFQSFLPVSDNPDYGFVGDVNGPWGLTPPADYGVHAAPVAELLRWYGLDAVAGKRLALDDLRASIARSNPVIAWVVGDVTYGTSLEYVDQEGRVAIVAAYEHVVIVTGYNSESVRYLNNGKFYDVSNKLFSESWGTLGNMAVLMGNEVEDH
jgi:uncharacterized protein YvpB